MLLSLIPGLDLINSLLDWAKYMSYLSWAVSHPATGAWLIGAFLLIGVLVSWGPFAHFPNASTITGKILLVVGAICLLGGFGWRAVDAWQESRVTAGGSKPRQSQQSTPLAPTRPVTGPWDTEVHN